MGSLMKYGSIKMTRGSTLKPDFSKKPLLLALAVIETTEDDDKLIACEGSGHRHFR
jgi:hypothetical protein